MYRPLYYSETLISKSYNAYIFKGVVTTGNRHKNIQKTSLSESSTNEKNWEIALFSTR